MEAVSDKAKRHERASELCDRGDEHLKHYYDLKEQIVAAEAHVESVRQQYHDWQGVGEKRELFDAEDAVTGLRRSLSETASDVVTTLSAALGQDQEPRGRKTADG